MMVEIKVQPVLGRQEVGRFGMYSTELTLISFDRLNGTCHSNNIPCRILTGPFVAFISYTVTNLGFFMTWKIQNRRLVAYDTM